MDSKKTRFAIIIIVLAICTYVLYPSIQWHILTKETEKEKYDKTAPELAMLKDKLNKIAKQLREVIPESKWHISSNDDVKFDISINVEDYVFNLPDKEIEKIINNESAENKIILNKIKFADLVKQAKPLLDQLPLQESKLKEIISELKKIVPPDSWIVKKSNKVEFDIKSTNYVITNSKDIADEIFIKMPNNIDLKKRFNELTENASVILKQKNELKKAINNLRKLIPNSNSQTIKEKNEILFDINSKSKKIVLNDSDKVKNSIFNGKKYFVDLANYFKLQNDVLSKSIDFKKRRKNIVNLGLDLAGGTHITLEVDEKDITKRINTIYNSQIDRVEKIIKVLETSKAILEQSLFESLLTAIKTENPKMSVSELEEYKFIIDDYKERNSGISKEKLIKKLISQKSKLIEDKTKSLVNDPKEAVERAIIVIGNRIDKFGVSETKLSKGLANTIFVELPGLNKKHLESTKNAITEAGMLNFHIVDEEAMRYVPAEFKDMSSEYGLIAKSAKEAVEDELRKKQIAISDRDVDSNFYPYEETDRFGNSQTTGYLILKNKIGVKGELLDGADVGFEQNTGRPEVDFRFKSEGARKFGELTGKNVGNRLAIVLDGKVKSAPNIQEKIPFGRGRITLGRGGSALDEANKLTAILKAGVLPGKLIIVNEETIGPSLGKENIKYGLIALGVGLAIVVFFMIFYYKLAGFISVIALILNLYLLFAVLSAYSFTLTLPGIAGIILTIGMAVDANVIIFERMKEEIKLGKTQHVVIDSGYDKAFSAIFDSNITTILAALILYSVGSAIVKGFGFTLAVGIACSMFTALFVTRLIFDFLIDAFKMKKVSI
ncbi:MAG: protein translocase subunit SecD [Spirochaetota bacterium]|nr:protein translocase subunit SecD [Spirochaetota bacterium]